jgi:hypothetical protein
MVKLSRAAVAAVLFAGAGVAVAQQPGGPGGPGGRPGFEKKKDGPPRKDGDRPGFETKKDGPPRKDGERKEADRKDAPRPPEALERELQMLRARISEVEAQLKKSREGDRKSEEPKRDGPRGTGSSTARGPGSPGTPGGSRFPFDRGGPGPFAGSPGLGGFGGPGPNTLDKMSTEQIKEMIARLQKVLEAKTRGDQPKKPGGDRGTPSNAEVLRRLEQINRELAEIRRSLGK